MKNKLSILFIGSLLAFAVVPAHADKTIADNDRMAAQRHQVTEITKSEEGCKMMCEELLKDPKSKKVLAEVIKKDPEFMKSLINGTKY